MKKIFFFLKEYSSYEKIFFEYEKIFQAEGFQTHVFDFTKAHAKTRRFTYIISIFKEIKQFKPDVVYVGDEFFSKNVLLIILIKIFFLEKYKILALIASQYIPKSTSIFSRLKLTFLLKNIDVLFCRNKKELQKIKEVDLFKKYSGLRQMYLGVPEKFFYNMNQPKEELCNKVIMVWGEYSNIKDKYVVGFAGRIVPEKGLLLLLECLKKLPDNFVVLLADRRNGSDPDYYKKVHGYINDSNLTERVIWVDDLNNKDIKYLYNISDVMVMPTTSKYNNFLELFGSIIAESMLCKTLIIGSDNGSIPEIIGRPDFIFKQDDGEDMRRVINRVYHLSLEEKMVILEDNYRRALRDYSAQAFVNTIIKAISLI